nr:OmpH family outer membrane protein [Deltaproteobacteria bacterium]
MHKKLLVFAVLFAFFCTGYAGAQTKTIKIASIDVQKALNTCENGKTAAAELSKEMEKAQKEWGAKGEELKREKENLERQSTLLDEEALSDKMRMFREEYRDWERYRKDKENDIRQRHNELVQRITAEIIQIADTYGKENGYTLILERSLVPYVDASLDVTDEIIKRHNQQYGKKSAATPVKK